MYIIQSTHKQVINIVSCMMLNCHVNHVHKNRVIPQIMSTSSVLFSADHGCHCCRELVVVLPFWFCVCVCVLLAHAICIY